MVMPPGAFMLASCYGSSILRHQGGEEMSGIGQEL